LAAKSARGSRARSRAAATTLLETYRPFPKQQEFHASRAKYRLFGGAAGPGKTKALLWEAIIQANEHDGVDTLLLRRTFPELEGSLLSYFRRDVPRNLYRSYAESKHLVTWWNGSVTRFGYCQAENDVYQYQGAEFLFIGIDELTLFTLKQWQFLTSRNRCPVAGTFPNMAGATNPGNIGHAWVKALWIERQPAPGMERPEEYDPSDYAFIPARIRDNPIYADDANYLKTLRALPAQLRQAFLEGDWNVFAGQYFDLFDPSRHVARPESIAFEDWWPRWISIDWGFAHNAAVHWHAQERGRTVTYRELVENRLSPRALAQEIIERSRTRDGRPERIEAVYLSPDAFAQRTAEATIADQMGDILSRAGLPRPQPADDDRIGGWMLLYQLLEAGEWVITENCFDLARTLPILTRNEANVEDIQKMDGDDAADSARYGLKSRLRPGRAPLEQRVAAKVTATDPTLRAIQARKALLEEQGAIRPVPFFRRRWR
jgi:phage terminase large subunit